MFCDFYLIPTGFLDGPSAAAKFFNPGALAIDNDHNSLFIADYFESVETKRKSARIRKLSIQDSFVYTVLGGRCEHYFDVSIQLFELTDDIFNSLSWHLQRGWPSIQD